MNDLLAVGDVVDHRVDQPAAASSVDWVSTQRISPSGRTIRQRKGVGVLPCASAASSRSVASPVVGMDEVAVRARDQLRLGQAQQLEPRAVGAQDAPSGAVTNSGSRTSSKSRCSRSMSWWVLILAAPSRVVPTRPLRYDPRAVSVLLTPNGTSGRQAARSHDGTGPLGTVVARQRRSFGLDHRTRAVAWRPARLRSLREQRAGRRRELHRGRPRHRARRPRGARGVPVPPSARPARRAASQELDHVAVYLRLEQARFPGRIEAELPASDLPSALRRRGRGPGAAGRRARALDGRAHRPGARRAARPRGRTDAPARGPTRPGRPASACGSRERCAAASVA